MSRPPTEEEILGVSRTVVDIFDSVGLRSCLFGSAACYLFGVNRTPNVSHISFSHHAGLRHPER